MTNLNETLFPQTANLIPILQKDYEDMCAHAIEGGKISLKKFTLLLSGISSCRKAPGIPAHMGYEQMFFCDEEQAKELRAHLEQLYGVHDIQTLDECCEKLFSTHREYVQFLTFWKGQPLFDVNELQPASRERFERFCNYAQCFYPLVKDKGFYAWDANESIGLCRRACACGILSEEEFWQRCLPIARRVSSWYEDWQEYAISSICGALYFNYRNDGEETEAVNLYHLHTQLLQQLLSEQGAWGVHGWYTIPPKQFVKSGDEILHLLHDWEGPDGCIASDRILVDGCRVGYMYREEPEQEWDSGWRFLAGDETVEYANDPANAGIYKLNTLCNYDPEIQPFLNDEYGCAYARKEDNLLHKITKPTQA